MSEFTLMIVDDEQIIVDGLKDAIDWNRLGFKIVGCANNGETALDMYMKLMPQAILMDIRMPVKSGLECLEEIKAINPNAEVILLSGYDDFNYAKKGIQLGAADYVLKMNLFPELEEVMRKLHKALLEKQAKSKEYSRLLSFKNSYMFLELIQGRSPLRASVEQRLFCVVSLWSGTMIDAIYDHLQPMKLMMSCVMGMKDDYCIVIIWSEQTSQTLSEDIGRMIHSIEANIDMRETGHVRIGVGDVKTRESDVPSSLMESMKALDYGRYLKINKWYIGYSELNYGYACEEVDDQVLLNWIFTGDDNQLGSWVEQVFLHFLGHKETGIREVQSKYSKLLLEFEKAIKEEQQPDTHSGELLSEHMDSMNRMESAMDLMDYMTAIVKEMCAYIRKIRQTKKHRNIMAVKEYVDLMYSTDLYLDDVAGMFFFSPGYLSAKFKEVTGMCFSKYCIHKRIEAACELLPVSDYKIYEIAERVGYSDEKHFSKLFASYKKMSPKEYRNNHQRV